MTNLLTERKYNSEIRCICGSAYSEYELSFDTDPSEWLGTWLPQTINGHEWIIYTHYNTQVLTHSRHEDAYWDEYGEPEATSYGKLMALLAYWAMHADVMERIDMSKFEAEEE